MPGLSNACYRVQAPVEDKSVVLYRKFECRVIDKNVEAVVFKTASK